MIATSSPSLPEQSVHSLNGKTSKRRSGPNGDFLQRRLSNSNSMSLFSLRQVVDVAIAHQRPLSLRRNIEFRVIGGDHLLEGDEHIAVRVASKLIEKAVASAPGGSIIEFNLNRTRQESFRLN